MGLTERQAQAQLHAHALEEEIKASLCDSSCIKYDTASGKQSVGFQLPTLLKYPI